MLSIYGANEKNYLKFVKANPFSSMLSFFLLYAVVNDKKNETEVSIFFDFRTFKDKCEI